MTEASAPSYTYAVAIGSNRSLSRNLGPTALVDAALGLLNNTPLSLVTASAILQSAPLGPSHRHYANAVAIIESSLLPPGLLLHLHGLEDRYGRRRHRRWGARTLDLDIILWSGGIWSDPKLAIPHVAFRDRTFVLHALAEIAPQWRDPVSGHTIKQLSARLARRMPVDHHANPL
ncbi:2-amino-4-hydroxy-6-hydroxymethyldihydropteridine diphosphokinase [Sphingobium sp. SCG-1]|uniref:2-amino-4-hydroxy-6- hydroxymethyldihydropteridine diphosphokinase n=1 Tax=Sphingobium sp. SCG-1 TaxID=2072936 RepID=UPI000CD6BD0C|nr:2-amino-4-hydroxy-6-hydroxymethyldihydropteridine diphosphokinase [Sphingobium sp. SCG-1]AUW60240.1 2-amino-4-hydroxy-6-hydroxymethyldihydropteridine diphosphokinase [Sphingobium sp. SCG-1]